MRSSLPILILLCLLAGDATAQEVPPPPGAADLDAIEDDSPQDKPSPKNPEKDKNAKPKSNTKPDQPDRATPEAEAVTPEPSDDKDEEPKSFDERLEEDSLPPPPGSDDTKDLLPEPNERDAQEQPGVEDLPDVEDDSPDPEDAKPAPPEDDATDEERAPGQGSPPKIEAKPAPRSHLYTLDIGMFRAGPIGQYLEPENTQLYVTMALVLRNDWLHADIRSPLLPLFLDAMLSLANSFELPLAGALNGDDPSRGFWPLLDGSVHYLVPAGEDSYIGPGFYGAASVLDVSGPESWRGSVYLGFGASGAWVQRLSEGLEWQSTLALGSELSVTSGIGYMASLSTSIHYQLAAAFSLFARANLQGHRVPADFTARNYDSFGVLTLELGMSFGSWREAESRVGKKDQTRKEP